MKKLTTICIHVASLLLMCLTVYGEEVQSHSFGEHNLEIAGNVKYHIIEINLGKVIVKSKHEREIELTNSSEAQFDVKEIKAPCACTGFSFSRRSIGKGESVVATVALSVGLTPGVTQHSVKVTPKEPNMPLLIFKVKAVVMKPFELTPKSIILRGKSGQADFEADVSASFPIDFSELTTRCSSERVYDLKLLPSGDGDKLCRLVGKCKLDTDSKNRETIPIYLASPKHTFATTLWLYTEPKVRWRLLRSSLDGMRMRYVLVQVGSDTTMIEGITANDIELKCDGKLMDNVTLKKSGVRILELSCLVDRVPESSQLTVSGSTIVAEHTHK